MKAVSAFEERLINLSSAATLKNAKQLLKNNQIKNSFRDANGVLHAVFEEKNGINIHTHLQQSEPVKCQCSCPAANDRSNQETLCMHAVALWMYAGLFRVPEQLDSNVDNDSANYVGLKNAGLEALAADCASVSSAEVIINAESAFPHVPSKWENAVLSVKLRSGKREYLGNLNNLRQLYFDKVLAVQLKLSDFSLLDRQIIRFLAINGEAENSNILLNSELTSELFHTLGNFKNFYRNNRRVIIHNDSAAEAVVLARSGRDAREYSPGICWRGACLEIHSAKVITGKAGCWVGKNGEYFWINADYEVSFIRNFFRLGKWTGNMAGCAEFLKNMPFEVIKLENGSLTAKPAAILLKGDLRDGKLSVQLDFVYDALSFPPDGGRLAQDRSGNFFLRQELMEAEITAALKMLKVDGNISSGRFVISDCSSIGVFLNELLPDWMKRYKSLALAANLARLANGGNQLNSVELECSSDGVLNERGNYLFSYRWRAGNGNMSWSSVTDAARNRERYLLADNNTVCTLKVFDDVVKLNNTVLKVDEENSTFEVPYASLPYLTHLLRHWQGVALPVNNVSAGSMVNFEAASAPEYEFKATLRSYQKQGVEFMLRMLSNDLNVILADEMGLGKTVQTLATFNQLRRGAAAPSLVIAPASLVENWSRECSRFLSDCKVGVLYGANRQEVAKNLAGYDLIITSYTMARRELAKLNKVFFNLLILDEAQHIKNPGTANAHSCKSLKARHKLVLTGTPLENSPEDLWSIFDFLHPGLLGSFAAFKREYANIGESEDLRRDLAARTAPFIMRRVKSAVAPELPPREDINMFCSMDVEQRKLYESVLDEGRMALAELERSPARARKGNMQVLTTLLRLRQICCHPELLENSHEEAAGVPSAKFELMQELLMEHIDSGHKVLLFSQFTSLLGIIREYLDASGIKYSYLDGATRNRQEVVDEFNNSPDIPVFLLSLKAGGTGLNLTSADTVMIYDPWWNPATELQAADRTHRIGQTRPVRSLKLLVKDSIEEKILALQERKQEIFDQVVDNPALAVEKFTIEDIKYLLS